MASTLPLLPRQSCGGSYKSLTFSCHFYKWDGLVVVLSFSLPITLHGEKAGGGGGSNKH